MTARNFSDRAGHGAAASMPRMVHSASHPARNVAAFLQAQRVPGKAPMARGIGSARDEFRGEQVSAAGRDLPCSPRPMRLMSPTAHDLAPVSSTTPGSRPALRPRPPGLSFRPRVQAVAPQPSVPSSAFERAYLRRQRRLLNVRGTRPGAGVICAAPSAAARSIAAIRIPPAVNIDTCLDPSS